MKFPLKIEEVDVFKSIECGFRTDWISGEADGIEATLYSGVASPWMVISIEKKGKKKRHFRANMSDFLQEFVNKVESENKG